MAEKTSIQPDPNALASADDVRRAFGALEDMTISQILAVKPSLRDLSDAAVWHRGDGDLLARQHHDLTGGAQAVVDILETAEEAPADDER